MYILTLSKPLSEGLLKTDLFDTKMELEDRLSYIRNYFTQLYGASVLTEYDEELQVLVPGWTEPLIYQWERTTVHGIKVINI